MIAITMLKDGHEHLLPHHVVSHIAVRSKWSTPTLPRSVSSPEDTTENALYRMNLRCM